MAKMVNAIFTDRNGDENNCEMTLKSYLQAAKAQPGRWKPADDKSAALISKVPLEAVPIGTTQKDVEEFEKNKGKVKGKKQIQFDKLMDSLERGEDVTDINLEDEEDSPELHSEQAPEDYKAENVDTDAADVTDNDDQEQDAAADAQNLSRAKLNKMSNDKLDAVISALPLAEKMKNSLTKLKTKKEKIDQILRVVGK